MTKGMLMMWGVFAEMERDIISQRVKSGMANAKAKGKKIGRPEMTKEMLPDRFWRYYRMYENGNHFSLMKYHAFAILILMEILIFNRLSLE